IELANALPDLDDELIDNVMVTHASGLRVLLAPRTPDEAEHLEAGDMVEIVRRIAGQNDYVIVDMPKRLDDTTLGILDLAERIVLLAIPTLPSIKNVRITLDLFNTLQYPDEKVVFVMNRVNNEPG